MKLVPALSLGLALLSLSSANRAEAQQELRKLLAPDGTANNYLGGDVALSGQHVVIGAEQDNDNGAFSGSAYVFNAATGEQYFKLLPSDGAALDRFGCSVAISGSLAVIGAYENDDLGNKSGSAYVFDVFTGQELRKLLASDGGAADVFGQDVAISGNRIICGATGDDDHGGAAGAAYLFDATTGQELHKLTALDGETDDRFGCAVAISGNRAVVGAYRDDDNSPMSGSAYVFNVETGQQLYKLLPGDGGWYNLFGFEVDIDGDIIVVSSPQDDYDALSSGSAHVFDVSSGAELCKLLPADADQGDDFGWRLDLHGGRVVVGACNDDDAGSDSGSAYVFDARTGEELFKLVAGDGVAGDELGLGVAMFGNLIVAGAPGHDAKGTDAGSAYVFSNETPGTGFCFGDWDGGDPCPCNNANDESIPGSGCDNGIFPSGANLTGIGKASVSDDTLVLVTTRAEPGNSGLFFQADNDLSPGIAWGNGLRCAGGNLRRLQVCSADAKGASRTVVRVASKAGNVLAGDDKFYQCWYRTTMNPPCGAGSGEFNATNGFRITWTP